MCVCVCVCVCVVCVVWCGVVWCGVVWCGVSECACECVCRARAFVFHYALYKYVQYIFMQLVSFFYKAVKRFESLTAINKLHIIIIIASVDNRSRKRTVVS